MSDYDTDLLIWSERQANLLRRMAAGERVNDQVDWQNIAEEIESLGKSDRREMVNRVTTILEHLMKLAASTSTKPQAGWRRTLAEQRDQLRLVLDDSPSLRREVPGVIARRLDNARVLARESLAEHGEQPAADLTSLTFTAEQVVGM